MMFCVCGRCRRSSEVSFCEALNDSDAGFTAEQWAEWPTAPVSSLDTSRYIEPRPGWVARCRADIHDNDVYYSDSPVRIARLEATTVVVNAFHKGSLNGREWRVARWQVEVPLIAKASPREVVPVTHRHATADPRLATEALYRMRDHLGRLLYIGITRRGDQRFGEHAATKPWWTQVATIEIAHYPNRVAVEHAEREAIRTEAPLYNKAHNPNEVAL